MGHERYIYIYIYDSALKQNNHPTGLIAGVILLLICFLLLCIEFIVHPYIKKITNCHLYWIVVSFALLIYFFGVRYSYDIYCYINGFAQGHDSIEYVIARLCFSDVCPFFFVICCLFLIFDRSRRLASYCCPMMIWGSLITLFGNILTNSQTSLDFHYIFIGGTDTRLLYFLHVSSMLLAVSVLLNTPNFKIKSLICVNIYLGVFFSWVAFVAYGPLGLDSNVSGLKPADWLEGGEFNAIYKFINSTVLVAGIVSLVVSYISLMIFNSLHYVIQRYIPVYFISDEKNIDNSNPFISGYYYIPKKYELINFKKMLAK